jgi:DNA-binding response OmpR family regulator
MKVLLIEDSRLLRDHVAEGLQKLGCVVEVAADFREGQWAMRELNADVIALDAMLPGGCGFELLRELRERGDKTPVLLLTALDAIDDRLRGFALGADDYVTKPFDLRELAARLQALARRTGGVAQPALALGALTIDLGRREAALQGQPIKLRRREFALLELLALRRGQVVPRAEIEAKLYSDSVDLRSNSVESAVSTLRRAIDTACATPRALPMITTVRGHGYRLDA